MTPSSSQIYIDGSFYAREDAKISVFDHGLLYGDGVFEGIRFYKGRVFRLEEHIDRLYDSAKAIHLTIPATPAEVTEMVLATIRKNELHDGYVRLVITRGTGELGLSPYLCKTPSILVIASTISLYPAEKYQKDLILATCATRRPSHDSLSPAVKSLNYLSNIMAKVEAIDVPGANNDSLMRCELPITKVTAIVSPKARPKPSMMPPTTPFCV